MQDMVFLEEIAECRRILAWSFVFAFYLGSESGGQRYLFDRELHELETFIENIQAQAEMQRSVSTTTKYQLTKLKQNLLETISGPVLQSCSWFTEGCIISPAL